MSHEAATNPNNPEEIKRNNFRRFMTDLLDIISMERAQQNWRSKENQKLLRTPLQTTSNSTTWIDFSKIRAEIREPLKNGAIELFLKPLTDKLSDALNTTYNQLMSATKTYFAGNQTQANIAQKAIQATFSAVNPATQNYSQQSSSNYSQQLVSGIAKTYQTITASAQQTGATNSQSAWSQHGQRFIQNAHVAIHAALESLFIRAHNPQLSSNKRMQAAAILHLTHQYALNLHLAHNNPNDEDSELQASFYNEHVNPAVSGLVNNVLPELTAFFTPTPSPNHQFEAEDTWDAMTRPRYSQAEFNAATTDTQETRTYSSTATPTPTPTPTRQYHYSEEKAEKFQSQLTDAIDDAAINDAVAVANETQRQTASDDHNDSHTARTPFDTNPKLDRE